MATGELKWVTFDDDDDDDKGEKKAEMEDFEFRVVEGGASLDNEMCVADEVFFKGQLLPLRQRPSLPSSSSRESSKCNSRSDSMDRFSFSSSSQVLDFSSSRSSSCISSVSRSQSAKSVSSYDQPRRSVSNQFYTHPSPSPQIFSRIKKQGPLHQAMPKSSSSWWGLFRLGLVKTPEIEINSLKSRKTSKIISDDQNKVKVVQLVFSGCKCSPDSVQTASSGIVVTEKKKKSSSSSSSSSSSRHASRTFEWLDKL